jgi:hypothetical protein
MYLCNAFSLNMLETLNAEISVRPLDVQDVRDFKVRVGLESVVGHEDLAPLFSKMLGFHVPYNRVTLWLKPGDRVIVGQYRGPRLPPGAKTLPGGAAIEWCIVIVWEGRHERQA